MRSVYKESMTPRQLLDQFVKKYIVRMRSPEAKSLMLEELSYLNRFMIMHLQQEHLYFNFFGWKLGENGNEFFLLPDFTDLGATKGTPAKEETAELFFRWYPLIVDTPISDLDMTGK